MKNLVVLGSTGSIGTQTLDVVRDNPELFHVSVLVANRSDELLEKQINEFQPELAVLSDEDAAKRLKSRYSGKTKIMGGREAVIEAAVFPEADTVVTSLMGFAGLEPTMAALEARKNIALANKETLVVAGELVMAKAKEMGCAILPVDSEHCALFQCLQGQDRNAVEKLILTASGGPFRGKQASELTEVTKSDVLAHPTWNMGQKITVDSASLVNKGLEVIEAKWLYGVTYDQIQVVVHPQSIVHSMVQYRDGTVMAQLGCTDMRLPIQYALTYPERVESRFPRVDFYELGKLTFEKPDMDTFRGLKLAFEAGKTGGTMPCVMNAANEVAVEAFLKGKAGFLKIYDLIENAINKAEVVYNPTLEQLLEADKWAREITRQELSKL
ncbi:1-deoxy-D-xylulose-5-phosphate reductoisomerase [uncultured Anaerovibrio sp.]|nr:1-deoxy-D-xylulose-5-phosphate reductoisomerase [uncultured Anaerovibrio sp.]